MRIVVDTDVIVASVRSRRGASRRVVALAVKGLLDQIVTVSIMLEYESVLKRPEHLRVARLTAYDVDKLLDNIADSATLVTPYFSWRPQLRDPADEHVLDAAVNGRADVIVTFNKRHFANAVGQFGIEVVTPGNLLEMINHDTG